MMCHVIGHSYILVCLSVSNFAVILDLVPCVGVPVAVLPAKLVAGYVLLTVSLLPKNDNGCGLTIDDCCLVVDGEYVVVTFDGKVILPCPRPSVFLMIFCCCDLHFDVA